MTINRSMIVLVAALIVGCDPGLPGSSSQLQIIGYAPPLSQAEFNQLPPEQQYKVASKLMGTMLRGIPVEEFFDLSAGMATLQPRSDTFLEDTREALGSSLNRAEVESIQIDEFFFPV